MIATSGVCDGTHSGKNSQESVDAKDHEGRARRKLAVVPKHCREPGKTDPVDGSYIRDSG